jgi:hypothetical protein
VDAGAAMPAHTAGSPTTPRMPLRREPRRRGRCHLRRAPAPPLRPAPSSGPPRSHGSAPATPAAGAAPQPASGTAPISPAPTRARTTARARVDHTPCRTTCTGNPSGRLGPGYPRRARGSEAVVTWGKSTGARPTSGHRVEGRGGRPRCRRPRSRTPTGTRFHHQGARPRRGGAVRSPPLEIRPAVHARRTRPLPSPGGAITPSGPRRVGVPSGPHEAFGGGVRGTASRSIRGSRGGGAFPGCRLRPMLDVMSPP